MPLQKLNTKLNFRLNVKRGKGSSEVSVELPSHLKALLSLASRDDVQFPI